MGYWNKATNFVPRMSTGSSESHCYQNQAFNSQYSSDLHLYWDSTVVEIALCKLDKKLYRYRQDIFHFHSSSRDPVHLCDPTGLAIDSISCKGLSYKSTMMGVKQMFESVSLVSVGYTKMVTQLMPFSTHLMSHMDQMIKQAHVLINVLVRLQGSEEHRLISRTHLTILPIKHHLSVCCMISLRMRHFLQINILLTYTTTRAIFINVTILVISVWCDRVWLGKVVE